MRKTPHNTPQAIDYKRETYTFVTRRVTWFEAICNFFLMV